MDNQMKITWKSFASCQVILVMVLILCVSSVSAQTDRIYRKNGAVLEGRVFLKTEDKVVFEVSPSLVRVEIPMSEIDRIERSGQNDAETDKGDSLDVDGALLRAENLINDGKHMDAVSTLIDVLDQMPQPSLSFLGKFNDILEKTAGQIQKTEADPASRLDTINQMETFQKFYSRKGFQTYLNNNPKWRNFGEEISSRLATLYYQQAVSDVNLKDNSLYRRIEEHLQKASELTPKNTPRFREIRESLGLFLMNYPKRYDDAIAVFREVYDENSDQVVKQRFYDLMQKARNARIEEARANTPVIATPAPLTAEDIARINPPSAEPSLTESPPSADVEETQAEPVPKRFVTLLKNRKYSEAFNMMWETVKNSGILPIIPVIIVVFVVFWVLPIMFIRWRCRRADTYAVRLMTTVKITGLAGLLIYFGIVLFQVIFKQGSRDRCPFCKKPIDSIEAYTDFNFRICPHCHENIVPIYSLEDYILHLVKTVQGNMDSRSSGSAGGLRVLEKEAMQKLIRSIITLAYRKRSSDLHIEPDAESLKIRTRIDGMLYEILNLPRQVADAVVSAIKVMAKLDISEKRVPQDGRMGLWVDQRELDLRINSSPSAHGEKISIRILDPHDILVDSTKLGLDGENLEKFERSIRKPYGLILVTGPTGSGKSTTLYVALSAINTGDKNIVTLEDPIEYRLEGINQQQVHVAANFTFASGLRSILRQDPDVIMVGEIRDKETAEIGMDAAATGHLVFTTLHTIDAPTAFTRLLDLGIMPRRYAAILVAIIAQRLVRLNCLDCKKPYKPDKSLVQQLDLSAGSPIVFMKGTGCKACGQTGYYGRTGLFEILVPDPDMTKMLETNPADSLIRSMARKTGMRSLREEGILKISQGLTTIEEVLRVTSI